MTEDVSSFLTIAELADRLGRSPSGIRDWRRAYRPWIEERIGADGVRRYPLARFREIAALHSRRLPPAEVRAALASGAVEPAEPPAQPFEAAVLARLDRLIELVEQLVAERQQAQES